MLSAGVVVLNRSGGTCRFLLLRAYSYWDFPKGLVERDEVPLAAAQREVEEEAGICTLDFCWGDVYRETEPYGRGKVARYYVAETSETRVVLRVSPELGRPEHHEARWVLLEQALTLLAPRVHPIVKWAADVAGCTG